MESMAKQYLEQISRDLQERLTNQRCAGYTAMGRPEAKIPEKTGQHRRVRPADAGRER